MRRTWTPADVTAAISIRQATGQPLNYAAVVADDEALTGAARKRFGSWPAALAAAGIDPEAVKREARQTAHKRPPGYWSEARVIAVIQEAARAGQDLSVHRMQQVDAGLVATAQRLFGGWDAALRAAGYAPDLIRRAGAWTEEAIIARIRQLAQDGADLSDNSANAWDVNLYSAARARWGTWPDALTAAGVDDSRRTAQWSRARVLEALREGRDDPGLRRAAKRYYGSIAAAREAAGAEPPSDAPTPNRIRERRRALEMSQTQLGEVVGRTHRWISLVEAGRLRVTVGLALRLAKALQMTVEDLFGEG